MALVRRVIAAPFRWAAEGLLSDAATLNRAAAGLLVAWAWVKGSASETPARPAGEGEQS